MSRKGFIVPEPDRECEFCHTFTECRPYGPNNEQICWRCGMANPETTRRKMREYLGEGPMVVIVGATERMMDN